MCNMAHSNNRLKISVRDRDSGQEWSGDFSQGYIEKLTKKTGCVQSMNQFYQLLEACLRGNFDNTLAEFLSYTDLEKICGRTTGSEDSSKISKRYLILTYILDTKKIQIPLPLSEKIERTGQNEKLEERVDQLERENSELRNVNKDMEQEFARVKAELDAIISHLENSSAGKAKAQVKDLEAKIQQQNLTIASLQSQLAIANEKNFEKDVREPENTDSPRQEFADPLMSSTNEQLRSVDIAELISMFPKVMEVIDNVR